MLWEPDIVEDEARRIADTHGFEFDRVYAIVAEAEMTRQDKEESEKTPYDIT